MRRYVIGLISAAWLMTGCVYSHAGPGILYMHVEGPLGTAVEDGQRIGEACAQNFWALVAWGDASLDVAKRDGGITQVREVSYKSTNVLGYQEFCTVVTGN
ncbi:MAG: TRL-like family protein [Deltaproteobacteria bacterium]|jgi:hypothetical protein|nr:TRL-like family protein [Deltaproteobacteria bacterium]MBW2415332.1 TRL-like family protein [Deltaproteobacteria bacterium]